MFKSGEQPVPHIVALGVRSGIDGKDVVRIDNAVAIDINYRRPSLLRCEPFPLARVLKTSARLFRTN